MLQTTLHFWNINFFQVHPGAPILEEPIMDTTIPHVHATLVQIVDENPEAWAPFIASWSLDLLGNPLRNKYHNFMTSRKL